MVLHLQREPFFFVRHGRTDWSKKDITKGFIDGSLNDTGVDEAEDAAKILASRNEQYAIFSSPLLRTAETAQKIAKKTKSPIVFIPDLREKEFYYNPCSSSTEEGQEGTVTEEVETSFKERIFAVFDAVMESVALDAKRRVFVSHSLVFKQLSLKLTGQELTIDYGEVFLFTPLEGEKGWTAQKIN